MVTEPVVTEATKAVRVENLAAEEEPPVLEPIPHVATPKVAEEPEFRTVPRDEERIAPTFMPMTEWDEVTMSQANLAPVHTEESDLAPAVTAESGTSALSREAEAIAKRVFSAPVQNEALAGPGWEPTEADVQASTAAEVQQAANTTEDVTQAPVVKAQLASVPATETLPITTESTPATTTTEPSSTATKHDAPVVARVAPVIAPVATTETTVSGPSFSSKAKDSKGVSSWLKTKFSRRASKPIKPETTTDSKDKGFIGGATLTGGEASNTSSDHGHSSMREVAMAGRDTPRVPANTIYSAVVSPTTDDGHSDASPKATGALRQSTSSLSISSLSSDEDTRGRSSVPREREPPLTAREFVRSRTKDGDHVDPALAGPHDVATEAPNVDPALTRSQGKASSSSAAGGEEFEEARDTFDSEKLSPPAAGIVGGERKSDSPARDSKFLEDL